jgi:hypothetical protein
VCSYSVLHRFFKPDALLNRYPVDWDAVRAICDVEKGDWGRLCVDIAVFVAYRANTLIVHKESPRSIIIDLAIDCVTDVTKVRVEFNADSVAMLGYLR